MPVDNGRFKTSPLDFNEPCFIHQWKYTILSNKMIVYPPETTAFDVLYCDLSVEKTATLLHLCTKDKVRLHGNPPVNYIVYENDEVHSQCLH